MCEAQYTPRTILPFVMCATFSGWDGHLGGVFPMDPAVTGLGTLLLESIKAIVQIFGNARS